MGLVGHTWYGGLGPRWVRWVMQEWGGVGLSRLGWSEVVHAEMSWVQVR